MPDLFRIDSTYSIVSHLSGQLPVSIMFFQSIGIPKKQLTLSFIYTFIKLHITTMKYFTMIKMVAPFESCLHPTKSIFLTLIKALQYLVSQDMSIHMHYTVENMQDHHSQFHYCQSFIRYDLFNIFVETFIQSCGRVHRLSEWTQPQLKHM